MILNKDKIFTPKSRIMFPVNVNIYHKTTDGRLLNHSSVKNRVNAINGTHHGEAHLYCSTECKEACPIYNAKYNSVSKNSRDDFRFPEWSNAVKERDRYVCQKCGNKENLYAHHILPIATHPQLADDVNNGITLCKECHSEVHQLEGCRYNQLRKKKSSWC